MKETQRGEFILKHWVKVLLVTVLVVVGGVGGYGYYLYHSVKKTASQIYTPVDKDKSDLRNDKVSVEKKQPFTVLLLGVDERANDAGRSDTILVLSVNPNTQSTLMFNIPRDTRTEIVGKGTEDKINHAYAFGGVKMSMNTVEKFLNVPIDYYVEVNMEGFSKIIDSLGGVDVQNKFAFTSRGHTFNEGTIHLDGQAALAYTRMRYEDPRGDLGRNERQREVLTAAMHKAATPTVITKLGSILDNLGTSVKTNITFDEMVTMGNNYKPALDNIQTVEINGKGTMQNNIYYYVVGQAERDRISAKLKQQLG